MNKTKAQLNWEVMKEAEKELLKKIYDTVPVSNDMKSDISDILYGIRQTEYRRGKEDGKKENNKKVVSVCGVCGSDMGCKHRWDERTTFNEGYSKAINDVKGLPEKIYKMFPKDTQRALFVIKIFNDFEEIFEEELSKLQDQQKNDNSCCHDKFVVCTKQQPADINTPVIKPLKGQIELESSRLADVALNKDKKQEDIHKSGETK